MSRRCPNSEYCGHIPCVKNAPDCRFRVLAPRQAEAIIKGCECDDKQPDGESLREGVARD